MKNKPTNAIRESLSQQYMRYLPLEGLAAGSVAFEYGGIKYDSRNWERGLPLQQQINSLKRHVDDFERRHDMDNGPGGSGLPHICMIVANALMLATSVIRGIGEDDRLEQIADIPIFTGKDCSKWIEETLQNSNIGQNK